MMRKYRIAAIIAAAVLAIGATGLTAYAASAGNTPAEALSELTGRPVESVIDERTDTEKTYGIIADEAGVLDEFKSAMLELKKDRLSEKVDNGTLTQEEADEIYKALEKNQAACDGTGATGVGRAIGVGFGRMNGSRRGLGQGHRGQGNNGGFCRGN